MLFTKTENTKELFKLFADLIGLHLNFWAFAISVEDAVEVVAFVCKMMAVKPPTVSVTYSQSGADAMSPAASAITGSLPVP